MRRLVWMALAFGPLAAAQSGHWEGVIKQPDRDYLFTVDIAEKPEWNGIFSIPGEDAPPLPLANIEIDAPRVRFEIVELPGDPIFKGTIAEEGADIKGVVVQSGETLAFDMRRTGEAKVQPIPPNTPLHKEFLGDWIGTLAFDPPLRLVLHLLEDEKGAATGALDSADRHARNLVVSGIQQVGSNLAFDVRLIGGHFSGAMTADGTSLSGVWKQNGREMPLTFGRAK